MAGSRGTMKKCGSCSLQHGWATDNRSRVEARKKKSWKNFGGQTYLFKERRSHDGQAGSESVRIEKSAADDTHDDDAESSAKDLGAESYHRTTRHRSEVGDDLRYGNLIGIEVVLIRKHGWIQILRAVRHEVEAGHEKDQVDEQDPVAFDG